eukprot:g72104.t1
MTVSPDTQLPEPSQHQSETPKDGLIASQAAPNAVVVSSAAPASAVNVLPSPSSQPVVTAAVNTTTSEQSVANTAITVTPADPADTTATSTKSAVTRWHDGQATTPQGRVRQLSSSSSSSSSPQGRARQLSSSSSPPIKDPAPHFEETHSPQITNSNASNNPPPMEQIRVDASTAHSQPVDHPYPHLLERKDELIPSLSGFSAMVRSHSGNNSAVASPSSSSACVSPSSKTLLVSTRALPAVTVSPACVTYWHDQAQGQKQPPGTQTPQRPSTQAAASTPKGQGNAKDQENWPGPPQKDQALSRRSSESYGEIPARRLSETDFASRVITSTEKLRALHRRFSDSRESLRRLSGTGRPSPLRDQPLTERFGETGGEKDQVSSVSSGLSRSESETRSHSARSESETRSHSETGRLARSESETRSHSETGRSSPAQKLSDTEFVKHVGYGLEQGSGLKPGTSGKNDAPEFIKYVAYETRMPGTPRRSFESISIPPQDSPSRSSGTPRTLSENTFQGPQDSPTKPHPLHPVVGGPGPEHSPTKAHRDKDKDISEHKNLQAQYHIALKLGLKSTDREKPDTPQQTSEKEHKSRQYQLYNTRVNAQESPKKQEQEHKSLQYQLYNAQAVAQESQLPERTEHKSLQYQLYNELYNAHNNAQDSPRARQGSENSQLDDKNEFTEVATETLEQLPERKNHVTLLTSWQDLLPARPFPADEPENLAPLQSKTTLAELSDNVRIDVGAGAHAFHQEMKAYEMNAQGNTSVRQASNPHNEQKSKWYWKLIGFGTCLFVAIAIVGLSEGVRFKHSDSEKCRSTAESLILYGAVAIIAGPFFCLDIYANLHSWNSTAVGSMNFISLGVFLFLVIWYIRAILVFKANNEDPSTYGSCSDLPVLVGGVAICSLPVVLCIACSMMALACLSPDPNYQKMYLPRHTESVRPNPELINTYLTQSQKASIRHIG